MVMPGLVIPCIQKVVKMVRTCEIDGCDRPYCANGKCHRCYTREIHRERFANDPAFRRASINANHRRRVRETGGKVDESLDIFQVFEEENWICQICGDQCDPLLRDRDPDMVTIDHIIPVSKGGSHTRANVQTAHFRCNMEKQATIHSDAL